MPRQTVLTVLTAATLAVAGCGGGKAEEPGVATARSGSATTPTPAATGGSADTAKFEACLRDNGADITKLAELDNDTLAKASEKCKEFAPNGGELPKVSAKDIADMRNLSACMRAEGFSDYPDPGPDGVFPTSYAPPEAEKEKMLKAFDTCFKKVPGLKP